MENKIIELMLGIFAIKVPDSSESGNAEIRGEHSRRPYQVLSWYGESDAINLPPGSWQILFQTKEATEEHWGAVVSPVTGWVDKIYHNYIATGRDYRDIVESAFFTATESGHSLLKSVGLDPEQNHLILKKAQP